MQSLTLLTLLASMASMAVAQPTKPAKRFEPGYCGIHVNEVQESSGYTQVEVSVRDHAGTEIGSDTLVFTESGNAGDIASELPDVIHVSMPDIESADLVFRYYDYTFTTVEGGGCGVGGWDPDRDIDCGFAC